LLTAAALIQRSGKDECCIDFMPACCRCRTIGVRFYEERQMTLAAAVAAVAAAAVEAVAVAAVAATNPAAATNPRLGGASISCSDGHGRIKAETTIKGQTMQASW